VISLAMTQRWALPMRAIALALGCALVAGCGAERDPVDECKDFFRVLTQKLQSVRDCAIEPVKGQDLGTFARLPLPPKNVMACAEFETTVDGKRGTCAADMDGDGSTEDVDVMVSDESVPRASYVTWRSGGECWFAWIKGCVGFIRGACEKQVAVKVCTFVDEPHFHPACVECPLQWDCAASAYEVSCLP